MARTIRFEDVDNDTKIYRLDKKLAVRVDRRVTKRELERVLS